MSERRRVHVIFRKSEGARFLSHLDLMATLEFSVRRAQLPVELSEGFNPRPRMSLVLPLVLGHTGEREVLEMTLRAPVPPEELKERLQASVPPGIGILEVHEVSLEARSAASRVHSTTYRIDLVAEHDDLEERMQSLLQRETIEVEEERDEKTRTRDLRPLLLSLETPNTHTIRLRVAATDSGTVRPEQVLDLLGIPRHGAAISRESIDFS